MEVLPRVNREMLYMVHAHAPSLKAGTVSAVYRRRRLRLLLRPSECPPGSLKHAAYIGPVPVMAVQRGAVATPPVLCRRSQASLAPCRRRCQAKVSFSFFFFFFFFA